jgi:hypothetical protein
MLCLIEMKKKNNIFEHREKTVTIGLVNASILTKVYPSVIW